MSRVCGFKQEASSVVAPKQAALSNVEVAKLLWDRWMHIERLLVATIFAMFVTTTVGLFVAVTKIEGIPLEVTARDSLFLVGAGAVYLLLSGYYYFMLTQNYAVIVSLLQVDRSVTPHLRPLWEFFKPLRAPVGGILHQLQLVQAAMLPLTISLVAVVGFCILLTSEWPFLIYLIIFFHIVLFLTMIWFPFRRFISTLRALT